MASIVTAASNPWPILRAALPVQNSLLQLIFTSFSFLTQVVQLHFPSSFHLKFADRLSVRDVSRFRRTETRAPHDYSGKERKKAAYRATKIGNIFCGSVLLKAISLKRARV